MSESNSTIKNDNFVLQAKTFFGLEQILASELKELGAYNIIIKNRLVEFYGDLGFLYKANYCLRTALRIIKPIFSFSAFNENTFYQKIKNFPWENFLELNQTFAIDTTLNSQHFTHSQYMMFKMKDAIVDRFREKFNDRPEISTKNPDIKFDLHISNSNITISLDSSGQPLFKRGYRTATGEAPINEVLAAGILKLADWNGKGNLLDPMCGSGTFLIEAAMIAKNIPAQFFRDDFLFQNWKDYNDDLFEEIKFFRKKRIKEFHGKIVGYDIDRKSIFNANINIENAELLDCISIENKDFFESKKELFPVLLVFNPPYNERLDLNNQENEFYKKIGNTLKNNYLNTFSWIISSNKDSLKHLGLKPTKKLKLYNGKLECSLNMFDVYEGSRKKIKDENKEDNFTK